MTPAPERAGRRMPDAVLTPSAVSALASELRLACMRISRRVRFESSDAVAPHQFGVLAQLEQSPRTPRELAHREKVSAPSMTRTVNGLAERGLVARTDDPTDGRQVIISLTPEGRQLLKDVRRRRDAWMSVRVSRLTREEQDVLRQAASILSRVASE